MRVQDVKNHIQSVRGRTIERREHCNDEDEEQITLQTAKDANEDPVQSPSPRHHDSASTPRSRRRTAQWGDIVTLQLELTPENGFVPEALFDTHGKVTFVLGWGNYVPGLHELVTNCRVGDAVSNVSIDAGWGERRDDLIIQVSKDKLRDYDWIVGQSIHIQPANVQVLVAQDLGDNVVLDANPPLAGSSYLCHLTVLNIEDGPVYSNTIADQPSSQQQEDESRYQLASFALGCFWGAELAFLRQAGVVGTRVGYSHGSTTSPTYDEVCQGQSQHRETVLVVYDPNIVTYHELLLLALERLSLTTKPPSTSVMTESMFSLGLSRLFDENDTASFQSSKQYQHGFYHYNEEQRQLIELELQHSRNQLFGIEVLQADNFYDAEDYHQQYLYKGGQSARKGCRDMIRCYG